MAEAKNEFVSTGGGKKGTAAQQCEALPVVFAPVTESKWIRSLKTNTLLHSLMSSHRTYLSWEINKSTVQQRSRTHLLSMDHHTIC